MTYQKTLIHSLLPAVVMAVPVCAQSVEGNVHLDLTEVPIYDAFGELVDSELVYEGAEADLQINVPIVQAISVRGSALGGPVFWGDTSTWDNPTLALGRAFPITYTVVNPLFGKPVTPSGVVETIEALTNGGPTEMTIGIPVTISVLELPGLNIDFNPGAELKWNVSIPSSADVIMNQAARVENLSIASGGRLTGNTNMIVREDVFNGGLFTGAAGLVEGDLINSGADSIGDRTVLTGDVLTVGGTFVNQSGAGVYGAGRIVGAINNGGHIAGNAGELTLFTDSLAGSGTLGADAGGTLILQNTTNSTFEITQEVALSGGTLKTNHGFITSGSGMVSGYGEINSDIIGYVSADGGELRVRERDRFKAGALLEAVSGGTLEWLSSAAIEGNHAGSTIRALDGGIVRLVTPDRFTQAGLTSFTNDGLIEVMNGGTLAVAQGPTNIFLEGDGHIQVHQGGLLTTESNVWFNQLIDSQGTLDFGNEVRLRAGLAGNGFAVQDGRTIYLDMADDSVFDVRTTVSMSGGTLVSDHGFVTTGSGVVRGFGQIIGDIGGHVVAEGGVLAINQREDTFESGALLEAASSGVLQWLSSGGVRGNDAGSTVRALDGGTVRLVTSDLSSHANLTSFRNDGLVEVMDGGTLAIAQGHTNIFIEGSGHIQIHQGGLLTTESNVWFNQLIDSQGTLDFGNGVRLRAGLSGTGFEVQSDRSIYLDMEDDSVFSLSAVVTMSGGTLVADQGFTTTGSGIVRGFGQINGDIGGHVIAEDGVLKVRESDSFESGALLEASSGGTLQWAVTNNSSVNGNRSGAIMRALDGGVIVAMPFMSFFHKYYHLTNEGMIEVMDGGTFHVLERAIIEGGGDIVIHRGGMLQLDSGGQINGATLSGAGEFNVGAGTLRDVFIGEGVTIADANLAGSLVIDGDVSSSSYGIDRLSILSGSGQITADVVNNGLVSPGSSPGTLTVNGDYTHGGNAELLIEIGGTSPGDFDVLHILGDADIQGGTLQVVFTEDAFEVSAGTEFDILMANSIVGIFDSIVLPEDAEGDELFSIHYQPDGIRVTALADFQVVPETSSLLLLSIAGSVSLIRRRRAA